MLAKFGGKPLKSWLFHHRIAPGTILEGVKFKIFPGGMPTDPPS